MSHVENPEQHTKRDCPVCGQQTKEVVYRQRFINPSCNAFHAGYNVVVCSKCGFAFADDLPSQESVDQYYRRMTKKTSLLIKQIERGELEPEHLIRQYNRSIENILPHLRRSDRILDIGCYTGQLLSMLREKGFDDITGLDPSEFAAAFAAEKHGVKVIVGSLFDNLEIGEFDFIILTHVLEHIVDLRSFILKLRNLLREGGRVYVETPDAHNFFLVSDANEEIASEHKDPFFQFSVEHVNYFTMISLANLMMGLGFHKLMLEPQVSTVAMLASVWKRLDFAFDTEIEGSLKTYIAESRSLFGNLLAKVDEIAKARGEIIVWGAGLHTQKLLGASSLGEANILAFVDSDIGYQGGLLVGKAILSPDRLHELPNCPILVSSQLYQDEIVNQILGMGLKNELVLLYPSTLKPQA
jgi:2-polyprenyl-3-methyl-5-hydroxy-6-metoxy-1,4-benzoquinol methylase